MPQCVLEAREDSESYEASSQSAAQTSRQHSLTCLQLPHVREEKGNIAAEGLQGATTALREAQRRPGPCGRRRVRK